MGSIYTHVFTPLEVRGVRYKNRIEMAPTSPELATKEGHITSEHIDYYRPVARGGAAIITMGNCSVDLVHAQDEPRQVAIDTNDCIVGLSRMVDMCESYDCIISAEVNHSGIDGFYEYNGVPAAGPSAILVQRELSAAAAAGREPVMPVEMDRETVRKVEQMYIDGALRLKQAGFRMCMIHGGHTNLIGQFSSPIYNKRTDEYGGSTENRARFAMEILEGVRRAVGDDFVIEFRVSADEMHPEGMHFEESKRYFQMLDDQGVVDILNVSAGIHTDTRYFRYWSPNLYGPRMVNVKYAAELKKLLRCKITTVAGIMTIRNAEDILANDCADFVAMARPLMADPYLVRNGAENRAEDSRPCCRCNWCGARIVARKTCACAVNPMLGRENELQEGRVPPAAQQKKVVVIGGGPAGMEAALTLRERGHQVVLFEKEAQLGGNLTAAAAMALKHEMQEYRAYLCRRAGTCGADIRLGAEPTPEEIAALHPDAIIAAVGAAPYFPEVPGIDLPHVRWAADFELGKCGAGERVAIIGAGFVGQEAAWSVKKSGREVALFKRSDRRIFNSNLTYLSELLENEKIPVNTGCRILEIRPDALIWRDSAGETREYPCDTVLVAAGMRPRAESAERFRHLVPETAFFVVGDAKIPRSIGDAVHEGFNAALHI